MPFPPGGGTDIIARETSQKVAAATGWTFVIDNKPGAGGNLGVDAVAKSPADGYTIVLGQTSNLAINPTLYAKLPYDPQKDLAPIVLLANAPLVMVTGANSPYKTLADAVNAAKAKPGSVNFASPGNGTVAHLTERAVPEGRRHQDPARAVQGREPGADRRDQRQRRALHVVGADAARPDQAGQAARAGRHVGQARRRPARTCRRSTSPATRASTPSPGSACSRRPARRRTSIAKLNAEFNKALQQPELRKRLGDEGADPAGGTPEQFAALIKDDIPRWGKVVKESGAKVD